LERVWALRLFEALLIAIALVLWIGLAGEAVEALADGGRWWLLAPTAASGVLCADFATGTIHWFCDRFLRPDTPLVGPLLIRPFREHHEDPTAMTHHGLLELHGNSCIPVIATLVAVRVLLPDAGGSARLAFDLWLVFFLGASMASNQFHMWAHHPAPPAVVRWLQRRGIVLSPERHARHHRGGFDRSYCMTSGLLNPLLDRLDFFGALERAIRSLLPARRAGHAADR
jgi:hypothetical protein